MVKLILAILAAVCFALDAFHVPQGLAWTPAGFCLLTIALVII